MKSFSLLFIAFLGAALAGQALGQIDEGRALGAVSPGCYFAQQKYCGRCGGNNDCRMKCNKRHESKLRKACGFRRLDAVESDEIDKVSINDEDEFVDRRLRGTCWRPGVFRWKKYGYTKGVKCTKSEFSFYGCSDPQCNYCTKNTWSLDKLSESFREKINC